VGGGMTNKIQEHLRIRRTHKINEVHAITCTLLLTGIHHGTPCQVMAVKVPT